MLISCKCLNFIASSNSQHHSPPQRSVSVSSAAVQPTADASPVPATTAGPPSPLSLHHGGGGNEDYGMSSNGGGKSNGGNTLAAALMNAFLQKYPRNFIFYSQCMDLLKQSIGPISDLTINALNQRDLIYSLTLDVAQAQTLQSWQISICINCNTALCAKRLQAANPPQFLINCSLLTNNEELSHRRADKSFSDTFGLLIMDHPQLSAQTNAAVPSVNFSIGSMSTTPIDLRQQRLRQLQQHLQQRLKREIVETDERIQRYTEQQFALLKSFREKSEQECDLLLRLIQRVPDQQSSEWLDRAPPALEVSGAGVGVGGGGYASRRRNTIGSRRDVNVPLPTTPTTPNPPTVNMLALPSASAVATTAASAINSNTQGVVVFTNTITANAVNRKMSNFDTPPATPEATPMSVGNSPTFQQQQQQQLPQPFGRFASSHFQQQFPTPSAESADDFLFELEGVDAPVQAATFAPILSFNPQLQYTRQMPQQYQRSHSNRHQHNKSDDSDDAEEAEDALQLDGTMPIPMYEGGQQRPNAAQWLDFAKSLPIEIANSPMQMHSYIGESDEEPDQLDSNVDIAASIKALAKSVHGEAVFGDLPRPRLRSQI